VKAGNEQLDQEVKLFTSFGRTVAGAVEGHSKNT